jgi:hypothetical protein
VERGGYVALNFVIVLVIPRNMCSVAIF